MRQATDCTAGSLELREARNYGTGITRTFNTSVTQISTIGASDKSGSSAEAHSMSLRDAAITRGAHQSVRTMQDAPYATARASSRTDHVLGNGGLPRVPNYETGTHSSSSSGHVASDPSGSPSERSPNEMVELFKEDRKSTFELTQVQKKFCKPSSANFWEYSACERGQNVGDRDLHLSQGLPKSSKLGTCELEKKASIREIDSEELRKLGDGQLRALAWRDLLLLEAEIELCCQDNAGLHGRVRQEMESVIEKVVQTIKHGGDMDVNEAIEYNDQLFNMQRKFEDFGFTLQKAKADLARVKTHCVQMRCRCWWCKSCTGVRKLIHMYRDSFKTRNKYQRRRRMSFPL